MLNMKVAQSCPTLCNPMDNTVHGILQDRKLEWVLIKAAAPTVSMKMKVKVAQSIRLFATPWTIQSMEFSRPEYWSG